MLKLATTRCHLPPPFSRPIWSTLYFVTMTLLGEIRTCQYVLKTCSVYSTLWILNEVQNFVLQLCSSIEVLKTSILCGAGLGRCLFTLLQNPSDLLHWTTPLKLFIRSLGIKKSYFFYQMIVMINNSNTHLWIHPILETRFWTFTALLPGCYRTVTAILPPNPPISPVKLQFWVELGLDSSVLHFWHVLWQKVQN